MNRRLNSWMLAALMACSAALAVAQPPAGPGPRDLTPDQKGRLRAVMDQARRDNDALIAQLRDVRRELGRTFGRYDLDSRHAGDLMRRINEIQAALLQRHYRTQIEVRQIVSRAQFQELKQFMHDNSPQREGGPHREGGPRPGPGGVPTPRWPAPMRPAPH